jgi:hypothetical protein
MSRRVIGHQLQSSNGGGVDSYASRVVKYVPGDIVAAWLALSALLAAQDKPRTTLLWWCFGVMCVATPLWIVRTTRIAGRGPAVTQAGVSTVAFGVWVFATGVPFSAYGFYEPSLGGVALILFTVGAGLVEPERIDERLHRRRTDLADTPAPPIQHVPEDRAMAPDDTV